MDQQTEVTVQEFTITKAQLIGIDERERMFFILLGFACNEIIILQKVALATDVTSGKSVGIEGKAYAVQGSFIARLLIAKIFEAWEKLFKQILFQSPFRREYEELLSPKAETALTDLKEFFGKNEYVAALRNQFAFHYPSEQLNAVMLDVPDNDDWNIYLGETDGNSLYYLSEMIAVHAMLSEIDADRAIAYKKLIDDRNQLARCIVALSTGCMSVFVQRNLGLNIRDGNPIRIKVPSFFEMNLTYFAEMAQEEDRT